jgi:hypothetical protein
VYNCSRILDPRDPGRIPTILLLSAAVFQKKKTNNKMMMPAGRGRDVYCWIL